MSRISFVLILLSGAAPLLGAPAEQSPRASDAAVRAALQEARQLAAESLPLAIEDLSETFGSRYPSGPDYLARLREIERRITAAPQEPDGMSPADRDEVIRLAAELRRLRREAMLASPLLDFERLLVLKRARGQHGLPVNHKCNSGIVQTPYQNEIAILSPVRPGGKVSTLYRPARDFFVGEVDLHWDADRLLFTMPNGRTWQIHEIGIDGQGLRQVSREDPDVDNFDACYLPDGRIVFSSTASFHGVPCWHGRERACAIYRMDADGSNMRQLGFDQDLDLHPAVLENGQVVYSRWDYTGILHMYLRPLIAMNPDGTNQRAIYGSNSYWPNSLYFPRPIPGEPGRLIAIATGYHGPPRMGVPVLIDTGHGDQGGEGILQFVPGRRQPVDAAVQVDEWYAKTWPKFLHPFPLAEAGSHRGAGRYFLVAMQPTRSAAWGIYLVDVFDNVTPILTDPKHDFFEPIPVQTRQRPPRIPDRVDESRDDAVVYVHDVYAGRGLAGVPRGTIRRLRVIAYHFGYPNLAGPDKIGLGGPWEAMRILGTVPVGRDGSTVFRVPARTPLSLQPLDAEGKAVQLMRSWYTAMPGERVSCVGCHERGSEAPTVRPDLAMRGAPLEIEPWYGPPRGFDFEREVQPVLDEYCVTCHDGQQSGEDPPIPDFRAENLHPDYEGHVLAKLGATRLHLDLVKYFGGRRVKYTPAYEALIPYVRRVGIEDDVHILVPGEYHADTSELIQMLAKGHHGVRLDEEAWDRLITWIDLNAPCHGTWGEVAPIPGRPDVRRRELALRYGGPREDFEEVIDPVRPEAPPATRASEPVVAAAETGSPASPAGWPFSPEEARRLQREAGPPSEMTLDLGGGVRMKLVRIPGGEFLMGDTGGEIDGEPVRVARIEHSFWMGAFEVTNRQFRRFDPPHRSGYFMKRYPGFNGPGLDLQGDEQPVVRVSWNRAMEFCRWLSERTGQRVTLPTEVQWEYACRAGTDTPLAWGSVKADFSRFANLADRALIVPTSVTGGLTTAITNAYHEKRQPRGQKITGVMKDSLFAGDIPAVRAVDDGVIATASVGSYEPNAWGLYDMHGNVAEWTLTHFLASVHGPAADEESPDPSPKSVVRGGSFRDRPHRARSAFRWGYPRWQAVVNVGFRVVVSESGPSRGRVEP